MELLGSTSDVKLYQIKRVLQQLLLKKLVSEHNKEYNKTHLNIKCIITRRRVAGPRALATGHCSAASTAS